MLIQDDNPYVGPFPLTEGQDIFGREWEIAELADVVISERLALLYSPSGAGKTSLLNAGLRPYLTRTRGFFVYPTVRLNHSPSEGVDLGNCNRYAWSAAWSLADTSGVEDEDLQRMMIGRTIPEALAAIQLENPKQRRLLVFDQFEELLTISAADIEAKREFLTAIRALLDDSSLFVLIAMREEFVTLLEEYMPPVRLSGRFRLDFLSLKSAEDAIKLPARSRSVSFGDALAHELALNLSTTRIDRPGLGPTDIHGEVEPMQIQLVCRRIWQKRDRNSASISKADFPVPELLTTAVDDALAEYYSETIREVCAEHAMDEAVLRRWLVTELVTEDGLRDQVWLGQIRQAGFDEKVVGSLEDRHLIRSEKKGRRLFYELAHDRLVKPILAEHEEWKKSHLQLFQRRAQAWSSGQSKALLSRRELKEAREWRDIQNYKMTPEEERYFLQSGLAQKKQSSVIFAVCVSVLGLAGSILAFYMLKSRALETESLKLQNLIAVTENKARVAKLRAKANEDQLRLELSETRAQGAEEKLRLDFVDAKLREASFLSEANEFGAALAALSEHEIRERPPRKRISAALLNWFAQGFYQSPTRTLDYSYPKGSSLTSVVASPTGRWLFLSGKYGHAYLVDRQDGSSTKLTDGVDNNWILDPVFYSDNLLVARNVDGYFRAWKIAKNDSHIEHQRIRPNKVLTGNIVHDFALRQSEGSFAVVEEKRGCLSDPNQKECWEIWLRWPRDEMPNSLPSNADRLIAAYDQPLTLIKVTPSGRIFVAGEDRVCPIYEVPDLNGRYVKCRPTGSLVTALTANDERLAAGTADGTVTIWPVPDPQPGWLTDDSLIRSGGAPIRTLMFFGEDYLLSAGDDQQIRLSDVLSGETQRVLEGHRAAVMGLVRLSDTEVLSVGLDGEALVWTPSPFLGQRIVDLQPAIGAFCARTGCTVAPDEFHPYSVALSPDLVNLAIGFREGGLAVYSMTDSKLLAFRPVTRGGRTRGVAFDWRGSYLGVGSGWTAELYDWTNNVRSPVASANFKLAVSAVAFIPGAPKTTLVAASFDGRLATLNTDGATQYVPAKPINRAGNRDVEKDLNSVTTDCSGSALVTTENRGPSVWRLIDGQPERQPLDFGQSSQKTIWAKLRDMDGPLIDAGLAGVRREFSGIDPPQEPKLMPGHYADVNKVTFGPYGATILSIDDLGVLKVRALDDTRDLLSFKIPAQVGTGDEAVRDFALQCQYNARGHVEKCALAVPLAKRRAVAIYDLGDMLASERLFPDTIATGLPDSMHTCPGL